MQKFLMVLQVVSGQGVLHNACYRGAANGHQLATKTCKSTRFWTILYPRQFPSPSKKANFHYRKANKMEIKSYQFLQGSSCSCSNFREFQKLPSSIKVTSIEFIWKSECQSNLVDLTMWSGISIHMHFITTLQLCHWLRHFQGAF